MRCSTGATSRRARRCQFIDALEAKLKALGCGTDCDGQRPLLCDGSRQAMGPGRARLARDRARRGDRRKRRARRGRDMRTPRIKSDEFVEPRVIGGGASAADGDQVICFNFRADRARELTAALALEQFTGFARPRSPRVGYVCMTEYDRSFESAAGVRPRGREEHARRGLARAACATCASPRPKNTPTSRTSSTAAPRSRSRSRSAC